MVPNSNDFEGRIFGVVIDTSGSMNARLLAVALGAIASYAQNRDAPFVRIIFYDAAGMTLAVHPLRAYLEP